MFPFKRITKYGLIWYHVKIPGQYSLSFDTCFEALCFDNETRIPKKIVDIYKYLFQKECEENLENGKYLKRDKRTNALNLLSYYLSCTTENFLSCNEGEMLPRYNLISWMPRNTALTWQGVYTVAKSPGKKISCFWKGLSSRHREIILERIVFLE